MYANQSPRKVFCFQSAFILLKSGMAGVLIAAGNMAFAQPQVVRNITQPTERLELTVNSSRILTLEKRIPKMVVNNPELVTVTPISANQVQLAARKPGVTQINLWDEDDQVYTVDLMIYGDVRELEHALVRLFPKSSVKVVRLTNSLVLEGFVERPEAVSPIMRLAEDYAPKIINNITVGGVQQILLKVKVMEVSRTKLRRLGVDWGQSSGTDYVFQGVSGLLSDVAATASELSFTRNGATFEAFVSDGPDAFLAVLDVLQQNNVAKILADPTLTAISGRPAHFNVGGELPIVIPSGIGQTSVEYKKFGTQVDFVPIVLGNGNIRLEVRPRVSEIDDTRSINIGQFTVPALKVREVDTAVELKAGQTLALAGLVQTRVEAQERGIPILSDLPLIGAAFRKVEEEVNEIELLILVTPEFADGMEPHEVPNCGPGMESVSPSNCQLYCGGHLEVPACGPCGPNGFGYSGSNCGSCSGASVIACDEGSAYSPQESCQEVSNGLPYQPNYDLPAVNPIEVSEPMIESPGPGQPTVPSSNPVIPGPTPGALPDPSTTRSLPQSPLRTQNPAQYSRDNPYVRTSAQPAQTETTTPGLIGPIGYDVEK